MRWSLKRTITPAAGEEVRDSLALAGRTEQIDVANGISSNYACQNWCDSNYHSSYLTPVNSQLETGQTTTFNVFQQDYDHYGILTGYYLRIQILHGSTYWNSGTTSVATINSSSALANAVAPGTTTLTATWQDYTAPIGTMCEPNLFGGKPDEDSKLEGILPPPQMFGPPETCDACLSYTVFPTPSVVLTVNPIVAITKLDGSPLPNPFRLGVNGGGNDRTQTLKATVTPANQAANVTIQVNSKINGVITNVNSQTGVITFNVVGNAESSSGSSCSAGDSFIRAVHSGSNLVNKPVFVSVPSKVATPHDTTGTLLIANRVLDGTTIPQINSGLGPNEVLLATVFARILTVTVKDQCNNLIGDLYTGARVTETIGSTNVDINQPLTSASTYSDPVGATINRFIVQRGSPEAAAWPAQPLSPMVAGSQTQNIAVQVDGFTLIPAIAVRTWTLTPPSTVTITWPN